MKLILTPAGPSDRMHDTWIPKTDDFLPAKEGVAICLWFDGKRRWAGELVVVDWKLYNRIWLKLCKRHSNGAVQRVNLIDISFFEEERMFIDKIITCVFSFMSGFTASVTLIQQVFLRTDMKMSCMRQTIINRVLCNDMAMWGVCGSAVACGCEWDMFTISTRRMPVQNYQTFNILHDCMVDYQSSNGKDVNVCRDVTKWHLSSGTGTNIPCSHAKRGASAFTCVKQARQYKPIAAEITANLSKQLETFADSHIFYLRQTAMNAEVALSLAIGRDFVPEPRWPK